MPSGWLCRVVVCWAVLLLVESVFGVSCSEQLNRRVWSSLREFVLSISLEAAMQSGARGVAVDGRSGSGSAVERVLLGYRRWLLVEWG